ncbi:hypothetical protein C3V43_11015 [Bacteroides heparinolyticus]|nr:hypothetical protein C3V43_11015 [Bacteroides heparinolyticus]
MPNSGRFQPPAHRDTRATGHKGFRLIADSGEKKVAHVYAAKPKRPAFFPPGQNQRSKLKPIFAPD